MTKMGRSGLILALNLVLAEVAFAQTGSIKGTLVDSQGGVIAGASVRAMDQAKGTIVRETTSGPDGLFELQPLLRSVCDEQVGMTQRRARERARTGMLLVRKHVVTDDDTRRGRPIMVTEFGGIKYSTDSNSWGYTSVKSPEELAQKVGEVLGVIRSLPLLSGFCYTQFTDTYQEANGLVFMDRTPKFSADEIRRTICG